MSRTDITVDVPPRTTNLVLAALIDGRNVSEKRLETLEIALAHGATDETLVALRDAVRVSRGADIVLPANRLEYLSRGRGWCRKGRGDTAIWGNRVGGGYRVGPGRWTVGGSDGFSRKKQDVWTVAHVIIFGDIIWTVAS